MPPESFVNISSDSSDSSDSGDSDSSISSISGSGGSGSHHHHHHRHRHQHCRECPQGYTQPLQGQVFCYKLPAAYASTLVSSVRGGEGIAPPTASPPPPAPAPAPAAAAAAAAATASSVSATDTMKIMACAAGTEPFALEHADDSARPSDVPIFFGSSETVPNCVPCPRGRYREGGYREVHDHEGKSPAIRAKKKVIGIAGRNGRNPFEDMHAMRSSERDDTACKVRRITS
jgi:hypothetical protein